MSPSHANKKGVRYRYYVSQAVLQNRKDEAGSIARVSAPDVEGSGHEQASAQRAMLTSMLPIARSLRCHLGRAVVHRDQITITPALQVTYRMAANDQNHDPTISISFTAECIAPQGNLA